MNSFSEETLAKHVAKGVAMHSESRRQLTSTHPGDRRLEHKKQTASTSYRWSCEHKQRPFAVPGQLFQRLTQQRRLLPPTNPKGHLFHSQCKAFSGLTKGTPNAEMLLMTQLTLSWEATQPCWFLHSRDKSNSSTPRAVAAVEPEASRARAAAVKADPS